MSDHVPALEVSSLRAVYGTSQVLFGIDFVVPTTGVVAVVGRNGAGKSTLLRTIMGYHPPSAGQVLLDGKDVTRAPTARLVRGGVGFVPQESVVFPDLSVEDNLRIGLSAAHRTAAAEGISAALNLFPKLAARLDQKAGTMSGGERKMVGIARALLGRPRLLVMDEPTEGVWHGVVDEIAVRLREYAADHAVLLVEQHLDFALDLADHVVVLDRGEVLTAGPAVELRHDDSLRARLSV